MIQIFPSDWQNSTNNNVKKHKHTNDTVKNETIKALAMNTVLLTKKLPKAELNIAAAQREKKG